MLSFFLWSVTDFVDFLLSLSGELSSLHEVLGVVELAGSSLFGLGGDLGNATFDVTDQSLNLGSVFVELLLHNAVVQEHSTAGLRGQEVHEEEKLDPEEVGDEVKDATTAVIEEAEEAEDDPVGEPLLIVVRSGSLECLDALECGVQNCDHKSEDGGSEEDKGDEESDKATGTEEDTGLDTSVLSDLGKLGDLLSKGVQGSQFLVNQLHFLYIYDLMIYIFQSMNSIYNH